MTRINCGIDLATVGETDTFVARCDVLVCDIKSLLFYQLHVAAKITSAGDVFARLQLFVVAICYRLVASSSRGSFVQSLHVAVICYIVAALHLAIYHGHGALCHCADPSAQQGDGP